TRRSSDGSCTGVDGAVAGLDLTGTTHTNAGSYTDSWSFTDPTGNYSNPDGTVSGHIGAAAASCSVTGYNVTYDGDAHTATGSCTGVDGPVVAGLQPASTHHNTGSNHTSSSFTDPTGNYGNPGGTVSDHIGAATASCSVTGYNVTYDSAAHTATGSCTGVDGPVAGLDLTGTTHTNAGSYTDSWSFTDPTGNY